MIIASWNVRGLNKALRQDGVYDLVRGHSIDVIGVIETKLNAGAESRLLKGKFRNWQSLDNFDVHEGRRILILWNPLKVLVELVSYTSQVIHTKITCKTSHSSFLVSFVYAFNGPRERKPLWRNLLDYGLSLDEPWLLMGDFNCVLTEEERQNGAEVKKKRD